MKGCMKWFRTIALIFGRCLFSGSRFVKKMGAHLFILNPFPTHLTGGEEEKKV
jgi:hypothetical protein